MLKIRLQRIGRKNDPAYRVVVAEHTRGPRSGNFVERVGSYNPKTKERSLNSQRIQYWMSVGAQPSDTLHNMLVSEGIILGKKINVLPKKRPISKEVAGDAGGDIKEGEIKAEVAEEDASANAGEKEEIVESKDNNDTPAETEKSETDTVSEGEPTTEDKSEEDNVGGEKSE